MKIDAIFFHNFSVKLIEMSFQFQESNQKAESAILPAFVFLSTPA